MEKENLDKKIEAILFYKNEPLSKVFLAKTLETNVSEIENAIKVLDERLSKNSGLCLITSQDKLSLSTNKEMSVLIEKISKEEMSEDIGKAGLETLSIILYKEGVSKREIDYIRGVNSSFILRNLLIRGLIERVVSDNDKRLFVYKPSIALLAHLGIKNREQLPNYDMLNSKLKNIEEI